MAFPAADAGRAPVCLRTNIILHTRKQAGPWMGHCSHLFLGLAPSRTLRSFMKGRALSVHHAVLGEVPVESRMKWNQLCRKATVLNLLFTFQSRSTNDDRQDFFNEMQVDPGAPEY